jgi:hypothetical protein
VKEYGSNVQKLADYIKGIEDKEKRTLYAHILVELMRQIHPHMKDNQDYSNKLWDDLYIMAQFELEVDSPYPAPSIDVLGRQPLTVEYNQNNLKFRHYGRNIELLIEKAINTENEEDKLAFVSYLYRLMRSFYSSWNKDNPEEHIIYQHLDLLSRGQLEKELNAIRENGLVESTPKDRNNSFERTRNVSNTSNYPSYQSNSSGERHNNNYGRRHGGNKYSKNNNNNNNKHRRNNK